MPADHEKGSAYAESAAECFQKQPLPFSASFPSLTTLAKVEDDFFSVRFARTAGKQTQWTAFLRKQGIQNIAPNQFEEVVARLQTFFRPMVEVQIGNTPFESNWEPGGPWC